jgi:hypothetical protein
MSDTAYGATMLVGSNYGYLFAAYFAWRLKAPLPAAQLLATFCISTLYHLCDSAVWCFGIPLYRWRTYDWIFAFGEIPTVVFTLVASGLSAYVSLRLTPAQAKKDDSWSKFLWVILQMIVVGTVILSDLTFADNLTPIIAGGLCIVVYVIFVSRGQHSFIDSVDWRFFGPGLISLAGGLVFFFLDSYVPYFFSHSLWHLLSALGITLMLYGVCGPAIEIRRMVYERGNYIV